MNSRAKYDVAQKDELEWWTNYPFNPHWEWNQYDRVFMPYYPTEIQDLVIDVGSGPTPILLSHNVLYRRGIALDPLIHEYGGISKYNKYFTKAVERYASFEEVGPGGPIQIGSADVVFCLNTLDHVLDPAGLLQKILLVLKRGGLFFLFVDVDKPPDRMHPLSISSGELAEWLRPFQRVFSLMQKSWKFDNNAYWYVGRAK